jgi:hypothetical protein
VESAQWKGVWYCIDYESIILRSGMKVAQASSRFMKSVELLNLIFGNLLSFDKFWKLGLFAQTSDK